MSDPSVEQIIKQLVLANADGEIRSIAVVMISHTGEPELQIAMAPSTAYSLYTGLNLLSAHIMDRIRGMGKTQPKDRE